MECQQEIELAPWAWGQEPVVGLVSAPVIPHPAGPIEAQAVGSLAEGDVASDVASAVGAGDGGTGTTLPDSPIGRAGTRLHLRHTIRPLHHCLANRKFKCFRKRQNG